jgi:hypothetical protein
MSEANSQEEASQDSPPDSSASPFAELPSTISNTARSSSENEFSRQSFDEEEEKPLPTITPTLPPSQSTQVQLRTKARFSWGACVIFTLLLFFALFSLFRFHPDAANEPISYLHDKPSVIAGVLAVCFSGSLLISCLCCIFYCNKLNRQPYTLA